MHFKTYQRNGIAVALELLSGARGWVNRERESRGLHVAVQYCMMVLRRPCFYQSLNLTTTTKTRATVESLPEYNIR